jgi:ethanolamine utilization protein EutA
MQTDPADRLPNMDSLVRATRPYRLNPAWLEADDQRSDALCAQPHQLATLGPAIWGADDIQFIAVGVDVGSTSVHCTIARVHLRRVRAGFASRLVVVAREIAATSPSRRTPRQLDGRIDVVKLGTYVDRAYASAGVQPTPWASSAVVLTKEALDSSTIRELATFFATRTSTFACVSATDRTQAGLAARGSGAMAVSRQNGQTILNVDVGGSTSKLALMHNGRLVRTRAVPVGGKLVTFRRTGEVRRIEPPALTVAAAAGVKLELGHALTRIAYRRLTRALAELLVEAISEEAMIPADLYLAQDPTPFKLRPDRISFTGGVSGSIYGPVRRDDADLAAGIAAGIRAALREGRIDLPVFEPGQRLHATAVGASQFSVQLTGDSIFVSDWRALPLENLPVLHLVLDPKAGLAPNHIAQTIRHELRRFELIDGAYPLAVGIRWRGEPHYWPLRALCEGIVQALPRTLTGKEPLVLAIDLDVGNTLGLILRGRQETSSRPAPWRTVSVERVERGRKV